MTRNDRISAGVSAVIVGLVVYFILESGAGENLVRNAVEPDAPVSEEVSAAGGDAAPSPEAPETATAETSAPETSSEPEAPLETANKPSQNEEPLVVDGDSGSAAGVSADEATPVAPDQGVAEAPTPDEAIQTGERAADEDAAPEEPAAPTDDKPSFDVVRIEPDGSGLVAGRATPGATVDVVVDGEVIAQTKADEDGAFVAFVTIDRKSGETDDEEKAAEAATQTVTEADASDDETPPSGAEAPPQTLVIQARPDEGGPVASSAPIFVIGGMTEDEAPVVVQPEAETVRVIQPPKRSAANGVTLDAISYDASGRVVFAGRGRPEGAVRLYLNGAPIAETALSDDGSWRTRAVDPIAAGVYSLRVDHIGADGGVLSRIETPFQREDIAQGPLGDGVVTVQRGDSLWRLAESAYGAGPRYTVIYAANDDQIRDPDLIYPGQIFTVPETAEP
ncbi:MAG: LysM peptidoglycan-binding domain-containing protein [Pseudomonadota bacterium]